MFGTDKFKEKARTSFPIVLGIALVLFTAISIIYKTPNYLVGNSSDFLLIIVVFILIFKVDQFKEKSKLAVFLILGAILLCYLGTVLINLRYLLSINDWKSILDGVGLLLGIFVVLYMVNNIRRK
jgi:hypothetical protein